MKYISVVHYWSVTASGQHSDPRWIPIKVPHGVEMEDMHEVVDGVFHDEVVIESIDIKCRPHKSRDVLQRFAARGRSNIDDRWNALIDSKCPGAERCR